MRPNMDLEIAVLQSVLANANEPHQLKAGLAQAVKLLAETSVSLSEGNAMRWIACADRMPRPEVVDGETADFVPILFYLKTGDAVCAGRYHPAKKGMGAWTSLQGAPYRRDEVSHWMPLPEAPK